MSYNQWPEYRRRNRLAIAFALGGWVLVAGIGTATRGTHFEAVVPFLAGAWFLGTAVTLFRAGRFLCPRCGQRFFESRLYNNAFARRCVHCKLPKWDEG